MYSDYGLDYTTANAVSQGVGAAIWMIIAIIISIIGGIVAYFLFVKPSKKQSNKFLAWLKEFLEFKKMVIEDILKVTYIITALMVTLIPFAFGNFLLAILIIIIGNIALRIGYEFSLIQIMIWKNTKEINSKIK